MTVPVPAAATTPTPAAAAALTSASIIPPHTGGDENPSAAALRAQFGSAITRVEVIWGDTVVFVARESLHAVVRWLHDVEQYDYLVDVTAVEYRTPERPIEVVWHLRALARRRFLRLKVELPKRGPLSVASVIDIYSGADWLERECFDMFGVTFEGHPDLRRLLMWEGYREGHPLRKDFPLRGRFSRAEQLKQTLAAEPEARYSMNELSIAEAYDQLPADMKERLSHRGEAGHRSEGE
ncbi:MAG: NADH-quinone oxidoreductase subunit C [Gemmatimonadaceae bacterium]|nr:NADH-quinone oxidoreductase subunit C [Gemmatimonadaceae bacterium]